MTVATVESGQGESGGLGVFGRWLQSELDRVNAADPKRTSGPRRGATWIAETGVDPVTGQGISRTTVQKWLTSVPDRPLQPSSVRMLSDLFSVPRRHIRELVAQDLGDADDDIPREWPYFLPVESRGLSARGKAFVRTAAEYACRDEGLL